MRLLVTRPEPDASALETRLVAQGHQVLIEPLITIDFGDADPIDLDGVQALIATSRNGLRALSKSQAIDAARGMPVYCVGAGTAALAKAIGLTQIEHGPRSAKELVHLIARRAEINGGPLLHLAGDTLAPGFADELQRLGFHVLQPVVYTTVVATRFSAALVAHLRNGRVDGVILLSPRTAKAYAELIERHNLRAASAQLVHFCLSPAVASVLGTAPYLRIAIAAEPNIQEMLALTAPGAPQSR